MNSAALTNGHEDMQRLAEILVTQYPLVAAFVLGCIVSAALKSWLNY